MANWNSQANDIFLKALEIRPLDKRQAYLDEACGSDTALRAQVDSLLEASELAGSFLDSPAVGIDTVNEPIRERPGTVIGPYKLLQQIGEGGMGTVYMAEQSQPVQRKVALKVIKAGMDSGQVIARFEAERQALALMDHPNIAKVLDAGTTAAGRPYFVMELVKGVPITTYCDENYLPPKARLELFTQVCQAVQHAHHKGVIHRDLKPTNVLVTLYDDKPVPKVIDFGVAKATGGRLTERTMFTGFGQIVGTLEYMSPEQARLNALDIDTRGDVYSLGVLLYELLTGTTPFDKKHLHEAAFDEMLRMIREEEPPKPSTRLSTTEARASIAVNRGMEPKKLSGLVRGELDWIVMKALEKDRNRRYETANGFAADVQRYLNDEPVQACPPSAGYRFRKFARRNKRVLATAGLVAFALVAGTVVSAWQAIRATNAETLAQQHLEGEQEQRTLAEKNATDANARRQEAEAARKQAIANLQQAREAVDQMLTRVSEERLLMVPQMEPLRKALLEDALKFYQRFLKEQGADPAIRHGTADAHRRMGRIYMELGQPDQANKAFEQAIGFSDKLVAEFPSDPNYRHVLVLNLYGLGNSLVHLGRDEDAAPAFRRATDLAKQLAAEFPSVDVYRQQQVNIQESLSGTLQRLGRLRAEPKTEQFYRQAMQIEEKLLAESPDSHTLRYALGTRQVGLGELLFLSGRPQEAEKLFRDVIATRTRLTSDFPHTARYRAGLADSYLNLFRLLMAARRFEEAEQVYRLSLPHAERLFAEAPNRGWYGSLLSRHYLDYGKMLASAGRPLESEKALHQALALGDKLMIDFPKDPNMLRRMCTAYSLLGSLFKNSARLPEAEAAYRRALTLAEQLVREFSEGGDPHGQLDAAHRELGAFLMASGRPQEATELYRRLLEAQPQNAHAHNYLAWLLATSPDSEFHNAALAVELAKKAVQLSANEGNNWNTLGAAHYRAGDWNAAIAALEKSMKLRKGGDSFDWFFLAMVHWQLGDKDEARKWYDRAVELMEKNKPQDEELKRFRAEAAELLGLKEQEKE